MPNLVEYLENRPGLIVQIVFFVCLAGWCVAGLLLARSL